VKLYFHSPSTPSWRGLQLKHRNNFTFTFYGILTVSDVLERMRKDVVVSCFTRKVLSQNWTGMVNVPARIQTGYFPNPK
jgi:Asp-tRNA(Asn)/Glu-tRNA(Gln) amidotransferase C subunit